MVTRQFGSSSLRAGEWPSASHEPSLAGGAGRLSAKSQYLPLDFAFRPTIALPGQGDDFIPMRDIRGTWRQRERAERLRRRPVDQELQVNVVVGKVDQIGH